MPCCNGQSAPIKTIVAKEKFRTLMVRFHAEVVQIAQNVVVLHHAYAPFVPEIQRVSLSSTGIMQTLSHFGSAAQLSLTVHLVLVQNYYEHVNRWL